jgi:hypothetical protein
MRVHGIVAAITLLAGFGLGLGMGLLIGGEDKPPPIVREVVEVPDTPRPRPAPTIDDAPAPRETRASLPEATTETPYATIQAHELDYEPHEIQVQVNDPQGNPMPGIAFQFRPSLFGRYSDMPERADYDSDEAHHQAVLRHGAAVAALLVRGTVESVTDDEGRLVFAGVVSDRGTLELLDDRYAVSSQSHMSVNANDPRQRTIVLHEAAPLFLDVRMPDGSHAESVLMHILYPAGFVFSGGRVELPATLRVPVGEGVVSLSSLRPNGNLDRYPLTIKSDAENKLVVRLDETARLVVQPRGETEARVSYRLTAVVEGLTDEQIAGAEDRRHLAGRNEDGTRVFAEIEPGEYVLSVSSGLGIVLNTRRVQVQPGLNEESIDVIRPRGWSELHLRLTVDGQPMEDTSRVWTHVPVQPRAEMWLREGPDIMLLLPPQISQVQAPTVTVNANHVGELMLPFQPASTTHLVVPFVSPTLVNIRLTGLRPDMGQLFDVRAMRLDEAGDPVGYASMSSSGGSIHGTDFLTTMQPMQPGRYRFMLSWRAGVDISSGSGAPGEIGEADVRGKEMDLSFPMPATHILTIVGDPTVHRMIAIHTPDGRRVTSVSFRSGANISRLRFLPTGEFELRWQDRDRNEFSRSFNISSDLVIDLNEG